MRQTGWVLACTLCAGLLGCGQLAPTPETTDPAAGTHSAGMGDQQAEVQRPAGELSPASSPTTDNRPPKIQPPEKLPVQHLPNAYRVTDRVISGGLPDGEPAFQELERLGVKTVISVDGMTPDIELAHRHGMRYVHLPHGYHQVPEQRGHELAKAVRDLPGPIYIHCHHGKHRSPSAAAVACVEAGLIAPEAAETILRTAGTSENYRGLYASARDARPQEAAFLDSVDVEFREVAAIPPLADAMVALEHTHDHIKQIAARDWKAPPDHPDLDPAHEALLLKEHFTELLRMDEVTARPGPLQEYIRTSETASQQLEDALSQSPPSLDAAKTALEAINANCTACHREFRDNL